MIMMIMGNDYDDHDIYEENMHFKDGDEIYDHDHE